MVSEILLMWNLANPIPIECPIEIQPLANQCMEDWSKALDYQLKWEFVDDVDFDGIIINFENQEYMQQIHAFGICSYSAIENELVYAEISLLDFNPSNWYGVLLHEIGHALGLSHSETKGLDGPTMQPNFHQGQDTLHYEDISRIRDLYGLSPISKEYNFCITRIRNSYYIKPIPEDYFVEIVQLNKWVISSKLKKRNGNLFIKGNGFETNIDLKFPHLKNGQTYIYKNN